MLTSTDFPVLFELGAAQLAYAGSAVLLTVPDMAVPADGRIVIVRGPNGAGKSTFLRWLYQTGAGTYVADGVEFPARYTPERILRVYGGTAEILSTSESLRPEDKPWSILSRGNRQKVRILLGLTLARQIRAPDRSLLLLDEPTSGLDDAAQAEFWTALAEIAQRRISTIKPVVVTHEWRNIGIRPDQISIWSIDGGTLKCGEL